MRVGLMVFIFLGIVSACVYGEPKAHNDQEGANPVSIEMKGYHFSPEKITIAAGTTVEWINTGKDVHTVTDKSKSWDSGNLKPGEKFSHRFDDKGTFKYICTPHEEIGMEGTITVN